MEVTLYRLRDLLFAGALLISAILMISYFIAVLVKMKPTVIIKRFTVVQIMILYWLIFFMLETIAPYPYIHNIFYYLKEAAICIMGYYVGQCIYSYCQKELLQIKDKLVVLLFPIGTCLVLISSEILEAFQYKAYLPLRWLAIVLGIAYLILGLGYFLSKPHKPKRQNSNRRQLYIISLICFTIYVQVIFSLSLLEIKTDYLVYMMPLYIFLIFRMTTHYRLLDDTPLILETILSNLDYGVVLINLNLEVIDYNKNFFKRFIQIKGFPTFEAFLNEFKPIAQGNLSVDNILFSAREVNQNQFIGELRVCKNNEAIDLTYSINSMFDEKQKKIATMITFRDITEIQKVHQKIEDRNRELQAANIKLEEHMLNVRGLTIEKERDILMTEINDTFGHSMTEIMALLEICVLRMDINEEDEVIEKSIEDAVSRARKGLAEMRESVSRYKKGINSHD